DPRGLSAFSPERRQIAISLGTSALCQEPTLARSLDHFVRSRLYDQRDCDVENLGGLEIDDQLELHRLAHGYFSGLCAFYNLVHDRRSQSIPLRQEVPI